MRGFLGGFVAGTLSSIVAFGSFRVFFDRKTLKDTDPFYNDIIYNEDAKSKCVDGILKYGIPDRGPYVRYYGNHALAYDQAHRIPVWVVEKITAKNTKGEANRKNAKFKADPGIDEVFSASNADYLGSGWSRGHMAPAGNNKHNQGSMTETFYLSNIVPQNLENNSGFWNRFEIYCRDLTSRYEVVRIFSGPLMMAQEGWDGKNYVTYEVIGKNNVAVPTHLYKIVVVEDVNENPVAMGAFIVPNEPISFSRSLKEYQVPLKDLERQAGVRFMPKLQTEHVQDLCSVDSCELMKKAEFELYFITSRINNATNLQQLQKAWNEISQKGLVPDEYVKAKYKEKYDKFVKNNDNDDG